MSDAIRVRQQAAQVAADLARQAGRLILAIYAQPFQVEEKADDAGPVTRADREANALIVNGLKAAFPFDGVVGEESEEVVDPSRHRRCWFVDPLDGTREFVARNGEFAVHVGLAVDGVATVGVVYVPVVDKLYVGVVGAGCRLEQHGLSRSLHITPSSPLMAAPRLLISRSRPWPAVFDWAQRLQATSRPCGSVGVKCGLIAEGEADLYLHLGPGSCRWDSCAPEAMLRAAGGHFTAADGLPYRYDLPELRNDRGMIAASPAARRRLQEVMGMEMQASTD